MRLWLLANKASDALISHFTRTKTRAKSQLRQNGHKTLKSIKFERISKMLQSHGSHNRNNPRKRPEQRGRRFYMLPKTAESDQLMADAKAAYKSITGKNGKDTEVLRAALRVYIYGRGE